MVSRRGEMFLSLIFLSFLFSWQSTIPEEGEEGALSSVSLGSVQIENASKEETPSLGVSAAGAVAFGRLFMVLGACSRELNVTCVVSLLTFSTDSSRYLKTTKTLKLSAWII